MSDFAMNEPLCPLDSRYVAETKELRPFLTEAALIRARVKVKVEYLIALSNTEEITEFPKLPDHVKSGLKQIYLQFSDADAQRVREIEKKTKHDVKAVEYFLREKTEIWREYIPVQFIHFALTSEDVTNLAYGLLIHEMIDLILCPHLDTFSDKVAIFAEDAISAPLMGMTHGQPATQTSVNQQLWVFKERLDRQILTLSDFKMNGKFGGAVANYSAHISAYPDINWPAWGKRFVNSLGLTYIYNSKQINPHDDVAELSQIMIRINTILLDLSQDMWHYIMRNVFVEKVNKEEVGSSTMPNKVNPINWENAEGNLGFSNAAFEFFARKLPISRMQRDLSDSTVQRYLGVAFGAHLLAVKSAMKGLGKLQINMPQITEELASHPELHAEAIQTVMRRYGYADAYEQLKEFTRGKKVTAEDLVAFVMTRERIPAETRTRLATTMGINIIKLG